MVRRRQYFVQLTYTVGPVRRERSVSDVLAPVWGSGHQHSLWGGDRLSLRVVVRAEDEDRAVGIATVRVAMLWPRVGQGSRLLRQDQAWARRKRPLVGAGRLRPRPPYDVRGILDEGDDDGDDGTSGVREPRRPSPSPGHLHARLDLP